MRWLLYLSAAVLVGVCATWAYRVNYATQEASNRVADLRGRIAAEREALSVLHAEWAYLNRPDRLAALVKGPGAALGLAPLAPEQFGETAMAPFPPEPAATASAPQAPAAGAPAAGAPAAGPAAAPSPTPAADLNEGTGAVVTGPRARIATGARP